MVKTVVTNGNGHPATVVRCLLDHPRGAIEGRQESSEGAAPIISSCTQRISPERAAAMVTQRRATDPGWFSLRSPEGIRITAWDPLLTLRPEPWGCSAVNDAGTTLLSCHGQSAAQALALCWNMVRKRSRSNDAGSGNPPGPILVGVVGFEAQDPGTWWPGHGGAWLAVARTTVLQTPQGCWAIDSRLDRSAEPEPSPPASLESLQPPIQGQGRMAALDDQGNWRENVDEARRRIHLGLLDKVVLARRQVIHLSRAPDPDALQRQLADSHPDCYAYCIGGTHAFFGASPELLVAKQGLRIRSRPLAGSIGRTRQAGADEARGQRLLHNPKDRYEHEIVVRAIAEALSGICTDLRCDQTPSVMKLESIMHLGTNIEARLSQDLSALDMMALLHPTPAVAGSPLLPALATIKELERFPRGWYAGTVGWCDARGDGQWALALRCGLLKGDRIEIFAGAGIMADSESKAEWREVEAKMQAVKRALAMVMGRPGSGMTSA